MDAHAHLHAVQNKSEDISGNAELHTHAAKCRAKLKLSAMYKMTKDNAMYSEHTDVLCGDVLIFPYACSSRMLSGQSGVAQQKLSRVSFFAM